MTKTVTTGKATDLITFTRSTTGTYLDSVKYGDELVTNGDFSNGTTGWTAVNSSISVVDGKLRISNSTAGTYGDAQQLVPVVAGKTYTFNIETTDGTGDLYWLVAGQGVSSGYFNGSYTSSYTFTPTSSGNVQIIARITELGSSNVPVHSGDYADIDNVSVKEIIGNQGTSGEPLLRTADTNEPRIEYDADGNLKGLLIEEQRTNNLPHSNNASYLARGAPISGENSYEVQAPSNTETVIKLNKTGSGYGYARLFYSTVTYAQTFSVFVKKGTARYVGLRQLSTSGSHRHTTFDLETKTWTHTGYSDSRGYQDYGDGWLRLWVTDNSNEKSWASVAIVGADGDENNNVTGTLYVYGFQRESGSFPTSYIPTSGSTVTRTADVASINVSEFEYNTNEGSIAAEVTPTDVLEEQFYILGTTTGNARWSYTNPSSARGLAYDGATVINGGDLQPYVANKVATGTNQNTVAVYVNGETITGTVSTNGNIADLTTVFYLGGQASSTTTNLNGHIKSVKYYPVRLTDNQLKALTQ